MTPREIKFRAWDKRFQKMEYGSAMAILYMNDSDHVIMQFTGLKDSQGVEIFEGDIVEYQYEIRDEMDNIVHCNKKLYIHWFEYRAAWHMHEYLGETGFGTWLDNFAAGKCKIIGDIYSTPDLLPQPK